MRFGRLLYFTTGFLGSSISNPSTLKWYSYSSGSTGGKVSAQMPSAPLASARSPVKHSQINETVEAFGAAIRNVTRRSAATSGDLIAARPPTAAAGAAGCCAYAATAATVIDSVM